MESVTHTFLTDQFLLTTHPHESDSTISLSFPISWSPPACHSMSRRRRWAFYSVRGGRTRFAYISDYTGFAWPTLLINCRWVTCKMGSNSDLVTVGTTEKIVGSGDSCHHFLQILFVQICGQNVAINIKNAIILRQDTK
jgi:hypothetical protein